MQNTRYYCDICKQEFSPHVIKQAHFNGKNMDFCEECNKDITEKMIELTEKKTGGKK